MINRDENRNRRRRYKRGEKKENVKEFVVKVRLVGWKDKVKVEGGEKTWGKI